MNEISLILGNFPKAREEKRSIIASLITSFIGIAYEGISSYLHKRRQKALHKTFVAMENKVHLQCNKIITFRRYNLKTLEKLINSVHKMNNTTTSNAKLFAGKLGLAICTVREKKPYTNTFAAMENKLHLQCYKIIHLEGTIWKL